MSHGIGNSSSGTDGIGVCVLKTQIMQQATNVTDNLLPTVEDEGAILYRTSMASADLALAEQHIRNAAAHTAAGFVATEIFSVMFFQMGRPVQSPYYDLIQLGIEAGLDPLQIGNSYQVLFVSGVDDRGFPATYLLYLYPGGAGVWDTIFFPDGKHLQHNVRGRARPPAGLSTQLPVPMPALFCNCPKAVDIYCSITERGWNCVLASLRFHGFFPRRRGLGGCSGRAPVQFWRRTQQTSQARTAWRYRVHFQRRG